MKLKEIYDKNWTISKDLIIAKSSLDYIDKIEQEFHLNVMRVGLDYKTEDDHVVCCSHQSWITKLSKSKLFTLKSVLISDKSATVLEIKGTPDKNTVSIKKKFRDSITLTDEERKMKAVLLRNNLAKKRCEDTTTIK